MDSVFITPRRGSDRRAGNPLRSLPALFFALRLFFPSGPAGAQEPILVSYERNFVRANLAAKADILRDAATDEQSGEFIGTLCEFALAFVLDNAELLREDPDMIALAGIAVRGAGNANHIPAVGTLWKVFQVYRDSHSRVEVLGALAKLGRDNSQVVENLNQYLANQNSLFRSGMAPDYPTLTACIRTLGSLGDGSSFPVLFSTMTAGYAQNISGAILTALESIEGNYKQYLIDVIKNNPPEEKQAAFRLGTHNEKFTETERGELAETALGVTMEASSGNPETLAILSSLRYEAVLVITRLQWTRATPLAIRHFYRVQTDFGNGATTMDRFLEGINCLGAMGNSEAAQVLALQLGFFNSRTEQNGNYDEAVIMALVDALGKIGDKVAFDYLLYIGYLSYPESVQAAAKEALNQLKW
jgi:HEAT repeat protein